MPGLVEKDNAIHFQFGFLLELRQKASPSTEEPKSHRSSPKSASYRNACGTGIHERDRFETSRVS
jgi:hypothetical protein